MYGELDQDAHRPVQKRQTDIYLKIAHIVARDDLCLAQHVHHADGKRERGRLEQADEAVGLMRLTG